MGRPSEDEWRKMSGEITLGGRIPPDALRSRARQVRAGDRKSFGPDGFAVGPDRTGRSGLALIDSTH